MLSAAGRPRLGQEVIRSIWAVLDQAAVSLVNFALNFSLARWASPEVYGVFVIVFSLLLLVYSSIQVPLVLDPLIILGGKKGQVSQTVYARRSLLFSIAISVVSVGVLFIGALLLGLMGEVIYARAAFLASMPLFFMGFRYFVRCFYIMKGEFFKAFINDASVLFVLGLGFIGLIYWGTINEWTVVILLCVAEFVASSLWLVIKRVQVCRVVYGLFRDVKLQPAFWRWDEIRQNWGYGKWLLLANGASYAYQNAQFLLLPLFVPLAGLAGYRASFLLAQPIYLFTTGLEAFAWNRGTRAMHRGGLGELQGFMVRMGVLVSLLILLYTGLIGTQAHWIMELAYGGKYTEFSRLIWFFSLAALFGFWGKILGAGFRSLEATNVIFLGVFYTGMVGFVVFLVLTRAFGVTGAAVSYMVSSFVSTLILAGYWYRVVKGG